MSEKIEFVDLENAKLTSYRGRSEQFCISSNRTLSNL